MQLLKGHDNINERLSKIKYQELKDKDNTYTDEERVKAAQSIYDAAINSDTVDLSGIDLPTEIVGANVTWSEDRTTATISSGLETIEDDDFTDDEVPESFSGGLDNVII